MTEKYPIRTRFCNDIVAEILLPKKSRQIAVIFCDGLPGVPNKIDLLRFFAHFGCIAIHPRYRGTWESDGELFADEPTKDILDVVYALKHGFTDAYTGEFHHPEVKKIIVIGGSFGGPASLLSLLDDKVDVAVAIAPIVDWTMDSQDEPKAHFERWIRTAFGNGYRFAQNGFEKLYSGTFYQPITKVNELKGKNMFIIHAKDDSIAPIQPVEQFARKTGAKLIVLPRGGHISAKILKKWRFRRQLRKILR